MTPFEKHFIQVGVIGRPKGTKGLLRFHSYLNDDRDVNQFKKFYLDNEKTVNLKLVSFDKKTIFGTNMAPTWPDFGSQDGPKIQKK